MSHTSSIGPVKGDWVQYRGSLTARRGHILEVVYVNGDWLTLDDGVWPRMRCRAQSVTVCPTDRHEH